MIAMLGHWLGAGRGSNRGDGGHVGISGIIPWPTAIRRKGADAGFRRVLKVGTRVALALATAPRVRLLIG